MHSRVVLVTGGSRGLGAETCAAFAQAGATVVLNYAANEDTASKVARKIKRQGGKVVLVRADVSSESDDPKSGRAIRQARRFGQQRRGEFRLSCRRHERGGMGPHHRSKFARAVSVRQACHSCYAETRLRSHHQSLLPWRAARFGWPTLITRRAKLGLIGFTRCLAKELGPDGITVNAVAPGRIMTDMLASNLKQSDKDNTRRDQWLKETPLGRFGEAREVADAILFLASDRASYITGQVIPVDGGLLMR
jgi:3-oxoacyl-[acyl-carrier protein] reductase